MGGVQAFLDSAAGAKPRRPARFSRPIDAGAFRRICQCLAIASDRGYSPDLVDRLNRLALRGHHMLYQYRQRQTQRIADFFLATFPALVREEWRLVTVAALLLFGPMLGLIAVLQVYPEFVYYLLAPSQIADFHQMYDPANRRLGMREADTDILMFGYYIWNNVRIGFQTFAGGMLAGVGSAWFLASNGVIIGAVAGYLTQVVQPTSVVVAVPAIELMAIVFSGAACVRAACSSRRATARARRR